MMVPKNVKQKYQYIDYACKVNERVWWRNIKDEKFEGVILEWNSNIAKVQLDDGTIMEIEC